ncbi:MAG: polymorphic toxin-type HINT domain-containing protein [Pirellulales bacterium]
MNLQAVGRSLYLMFVGVTFSSANASDPDAVMQASALVGQAIQAEIDGDLVGRDRMLKEATQIDATFAPAHWLQGQVFINGKWTTIEDSISDAKSNRILAEYESMRAMQPASVQGNWQAAQWCAKNGMATQCRAHLENILMLDHDNQEARKLLGHQLVGADWLTPADQARLIQRAEFVRSGEAKYGAKIEGLIRKAIFGSSIQKQAAEAELDRIDDSLAIPVLERTANLGTATASIAVSLLTKLEHPESAKSLMRIAVLFPDQQIRDAAIEGLKQKSLHDFVPEMLSAMSSPVLSLTTPIFGPNGKVTGFRQSFAKEGMEDYRTFDFDTQLVTQLVGEGVNSETKELTTSSRYLLDVDLSKPFGQRRTWFDIRTTSKYLQTDPSQVQAMFEQAMMIEQMVKAAAIVSVVQRQAQVEQENHRIGLTNRRIANVLSDIVNVEFLQIPGDAWNWWDKYNETSYQKSKYSRYKYDRSNYAVPMPYTFESLGEPVSSKSSYSIYKASCFVAGTKINTLRGLMEIEKIMPGDQVLSQDIQTGELGYKPVVCATNRDPAKTVILKVDDDTIHATTSHLLWVSGKGWVKAGEIKVGDLLHTTAEPAVVVSSTPGPELPTHNLIVADTHNYFVGSSRVLSHDVLPRASIQEQVPGQTLFTANTK